MQPEGLRDDYTKRGSTQSSTTQTITQTQTMIDDNEESYMKATAIDFVVDYLLDDQAFAEWISTVTVDEANRSTTLSARNYCSQRTDSQLQSI